MSGGRSSIKSMLKNQNWWGAVWKGLVSDKRGKHYRKIRSALWLFIYLIVHADRKKGELMRKCKTISLDMGIKKRTIRNWLRILKKHRYIAIKNTGRYLLIRIKKWRPILTEYHYSAAQRDRTMPTRVAGRRYSEGERPDDRISSLLSQKIKEVKFRNDIALKKDILNNDIVSKNSYNRKWIKNFKPKSRKEVLALEIAESLNDRKNLGLYLSYIKRYPETVVWKAYGEVKEKPFGEIKKSKGALFTYLVQKYAKEK